MAISGKRGHASTHRLLCQHWFELLNGIDWWENFRTLYAIPLKLFRQRHVGINNLVFCCIGNSGMHNFPPASVVVSFISFWSSSSVNFFQFHFLVCPLAFACCFLFVDFFILIFLFACIQAAAILSAVNTRLACSFCCTTCYIGVLTHITVILHAVEMEILLLLFLLFAATKVGMGCSC